MMKTLFLAVWVCVGTASADELAKYDVVWDSPSKDAHGSMPLGNGDIGINAWVEPSGDLVFYVSKTDAWDENGRLCKVGRVRVKFDPPLAVTNGFRQELDLRDGITKITAGSAHLQLWVDAKQPVVRLEEESGTPESCHAAVELWRLRERPYVANDDSHSGGGQEAFKAVVLPDVVVTSSAPRVVWYHRDNTQNVYQLCLKNQHMEALKDRFPDPLLNLTFGASLSGRDFVRDGAQAIQTEKPARQVALSVTALTAQTGTPDAWLARLDGLEKASATPDLQAHEAWWNAFWERSWIFVNVDQALDMPVNKLPWRVGTASNGGSRFGGEITGPLVIGHALSPDEIARLAGKERTQEKELHPEELNGGCTVAAWIKPAAGETGRILDKCTAGAPDGVTFDTYPGLSLRWIVGDNTMIAPGCLKPDEWQHVAATVDAKSGVRRIFLDGKLVKEVPGASSDGETVTRGYVLQRFINACSGRGGSPIKFNGSIFTVEAGPGASPETPAGNPDWRQWGGCYWFQNTRLAYWPMLEAGDFDMMNPWFQMYLKALPLSKARIETYYKFADAAEFPETMYWWGLPDNSDYGWGNRVPEPANSYIRRYWDGGLELTAVMLDRYDFTRDEKFARDTLVPLAGPLISFLDQYWQKRDANGKILFEPAQSLETWHVAVNPMPEIAGLRFLLPRLLALPDSITTKDQRERWKHMMGELPPLPEAEVNGRKLLRPADSFSNKRNNENPELYAVFPYRLFGVGRPDIELARDTYNARGSRINVGWGQDSIDAARLGMAGEASRLLAGRAALHNPGYRFPAMWGPNFDWVPDQDHGNNILTTLQYMLLQYDGKKIYLLPAWPKDWDVSFKLHAPKQTTVEGTYRNGKVESLKVTPSSRRNDVQIIDGTEEAK